MEFSIIAVIAVLAVSFQLLFIFTVINLGKNCLFTFWSPSLRPEFSPFWLYVASIVILLSIAGFSIFTAVIGPLGGSASSTIISITVFLFLVFWSWRMVAFWQYFQFEADQQLSTFWVSQFDLDFQIYDEKTISTGILECEKGF